MPMSPPPAVRLALLGAGIFPHRAHHPPLLKLQQECRVKVVAIWSRTAKSAKSLANKYGNDEIKVHEGEDGLAEVLKMEGVDAAVVAVPIWRTKEIVERTLSAGKHVLSEKPMAASVEEGRSLLSTYERLRSDTMQTQAELPRYCVAENYRFEQAMRRGRELVSQHCGKLIAVDLTAHVAFQPGNLYESTEWRREAQHQGGNILDSGVHYVAGLKTVIGLVDGEIKRVGANVSKRSEHLAKADTLIGFIEFANVAASICLSMATKEASFQMRIAGVNGVVRICRGKREEKSGYWIYKEFPELPEKETRPEFYTFCGVDDEIEAFIDECQGVKKWPELSPRNAFDDVACMESFFKASDSHTIVDVPKI